MRSRTEPDLAGRCPRCRVRDAWCICDRVPVVHARTQVVIVRYHLETMRASGTARMAELALDHCRIVEAKPPYDAANRELSALDSAWLLFPGGSSVGQMGAPPSQLVILDGTWREVRRLRRRLPSLWHLPQLSLPPKSTAPLRLRHSLRDEHRSTLEAVADALALIEGPEAAEPLLDLHTLFVEHSLKARGAWSYRGPKD